MIRIQTRIGRGRKQKPAKSSDVGLVPLLFTVFLVGCMSGQPSTSETQHSYTPPAGFIPDSSTAVAVAEAVLLALHGEVRIHQWAPLRAALTDGVWSITGGSATDAVLLQIGKADGRILGEAPTGGFIPDAATAVRVAEAVLNPVYGAKQIGGQKPLTASEQDDVWTVTGQLPPSTLGGVAMVEIAKADGVIRRMSHGR